MNCEDIRITVNYQEPGSRGRDAYEVWLLNGGTGSYEDYFTALQQPAIDAGIRADEATERTETATDNANTATNQANTATQDASNAAEKANNAKGWTERYTDEIYTVDGVDRVIRQLTDYHNGTGDKPTDNIGMYVSLTGFTDDKNEAINYKGEKLKFVFELDDDMNLTLITE